MIYFKGCHHEDPDLDSNQMHETFKKVENMSWKLYEILGQNQVSETQIEFQHLEITKFNNTLSASALSEAFAVFLIAAWQVWIVQRMLEDKNII